MSLTVIGWNHRTCPIELRERLHFRQEELHDALAALSERLDGAAAVILSTCNRMEVYVHAPGFPRAPESAVCSFLQAWHAIPVDAFRGYLYLHTGQDAVRHLFRVTASLDSLVLGEDQIVGQVRQAFDAACKQGFTDKILNALFQRAFAVAKAVRNDTAIASGKVSVASVAVDIAASACGDLTGKTVMVIGSGKMGEAALNYLAEQGVGKILIVNRDIQRAENLASRHQGHAIALDRLTDFLPEADIVISSTASPGYILGPADFQRAMETRPDRPMCVVDIAMPRDIDPAVHGLPDVHLFHTDDLQQVTTSHMELRRRELTHCSAMVERGVEQFWDWRLGLAAEPTIVSMSEELNAIRRRELEKTLEALPHLTQAQRDEIDYLSRRIVNSVLQRPMKQLKREVAKQDPYSILPIVHRLFGLNGFA